MVTTDGGAVVVGLGLRYVILVDTTVGVGPPTLNTVVRVRIVAPGPDGTCPDSTATHWEYQMLGGGTMFSKKNGIYIKIFDMNWKGGPLTCHHSCSTRQSDMLLDPSSSVRRLHSVSLKSHSRSFTTVCLLH